MAAASPSIATGFSADDYFHQHRLRGDTTLIAPSPLPLDMFLFLDGNPETVKRWARNGMLPFWADPTARLAFFRPLSSATHLLDGRLWPDRAWPMHLHSLAWFALALAAAGLVFRQLEGSRIPALLALVVFAADDAHGPAVGWIANRNAMVSLALALPTLALHDRWRRQEWRAGAVLGPAALLIGLLAGEASLAMGAYLVSYALILDTRGPRAGLIAVLPYGVSVLLWGAAYAGLNYGARGSGVYVDPIREPLAFAAAVVARLPTLLAAQLALPWSESWALGQMIGGVAPLVVMGLALLVLAAVIWLLWPLLARDRLARFWLLGMALAAVPVCATVPADRLLGFIGVGGAAVIARYFAYELDNSKAGNRPPLPRRAGFRTLVALHLVLAPLLLPLRSTSMKSVNDALMNADRGVPRTADIANKSLVLLNPPTDFLVFYIALVRQSLGIPRPAETTWLASGTSRVRYERIDDRTLRVEPEGGFYRLVSEQLPRSPRKPYPIDYVADLGFAKARVTRLTPDGRPAEALFTFDRPLEDPSFLWLRWGETTFEPAQPPPIGETLELPAVDLGRALFPH